MYGKIKPINELVKLSPENLTNKGINTQWTGTIIPIKKKDIAVEENFHFIRPIAKAAIAPTNKLTTKEIPHTIAEFKVAIPNLPLFQAKEKFLNCQTSGNEKGFANTSPFVLNETDNIHNKGRI